LCFGFCNRDGECLLRGTKLIVKYNGSYFLFSASPATAQTFRRRPVTTEASVRSQVSPCEICDGQIDNGTGFSSRTSLFPCQYHSTSAPYSSSSTRCCYQKDKPTKPWNISKSNAVSESGEHWIEKCFHFLVCKELESFEVWC